MPNTLYTNDNLFILNGLNSNSVDLIYLDPPFNSKRVYSAPVGSKAAGLSFKDMWTWEDVNEEYLANLDVRFPGLMDFVLSAGKFHSKAMAAYLTYMAQRIIEMHRILKDTGSIYLHCDPTASHYLKILMDNLFGKKRFINEIVWCYKKWASATRMLPKSHDIVLWYSKTDKYVLNHQYQARSESTIRRFGTKVINAKFVDGQRVPSTMLEEESPGSKVIDWWNIPIIAPSAKERTGYPTQKPLALLKRIIEIGSNEGDVVLDPFCGCATTCVAAQQLSRKWIGIDIEKQAVDILVERLSDDAGIFKNFVHIKTIPQRTDVKLEPPSASIKERLYKEQSGKCNGCGKEFDIWNLEIDHIIPKAKGGGNYYENYQLLCGNCNRIKGERPMEFLLNRIKRRAMEIQNIVF